MIGGCLGSRVAVPSSRLGLLPGMVDGGLSTNTDPFCFGAIR